MKYASRDFVYCLTFLMQLEDLPPFLQLMPFDKGPSLQLMPI